MPTNTQIGKKGEDIAADFILKLGYEIVLRNYRKGRFEIDIIAKDKNRLVFIEVKLRKSNTYGFPEEAVTKNKIEQIKSAAESYIFEIDWKFDIRFDIISITSSSKNNPEIVHLVDAF